MNVDEISKYIDKKFLHQNGKTYEIYGADVCQKLFFAVPLDGIPVDGNLYQSLDVIKIKVKDICLIYFL